MIIVCILIILPVLILLMIKPNARRIQGFPSTLFAHRGLHDKNVPENSLTAFKKAREKGFGVELDVRLTRDKKLVVFHDDSLKRLCGKDKEVIEMTYDQLSNYCISGTDEKIPLFKDVLEVLQDTPVICEIKCGQGQPVTEISEKVCCEIENYKGFICIESFNPFVVQWFRKNRPDIIRGQLSMNSFKQPGTLPFIQSFAMTHLLVNMLSRPDFIAYRFSDDSFGFFLLRLIFKPVCVAWTIEREEDQKMTGSKYSAFIFDNL